MYQALYRKYRPLDFDSVCGQEHITSILKYEVTEGKTSHAYLFCGSRGTGKTTCAKILARAINCASPVNGNPCGECEYCRAIESMTTTDVIEMDAASNNGVENVRDIRDEVVYTPSLLKKRVYIVDEVHMLSTSAFNALLKTIEEPPEHVVFILATTELHKLPATIVSRCQRFDFKRIPVSVIAKRLMHISEQENLRLTEGAAELIARKAQGGMRDAISLAELCASSGALADEAYVSSLLGVSGYDKMKRMASAVKNTDYTAIFTEINEVYHNSGDISVYFSELISFWRDMMVAKSISSSRSYLDLTESEEQILNECAGWFTTRTLNYHNRIFQSAIADMQRSPETKRITAEMALIRLCNPELNTGVDALSARISELEDRLALMELGVAVPQKKADNSRSDENKVSSPQEQMQTEKSVSDTSNPPSATSESNQSSEKTGDAALTRKKIRNFKDITAKIGDSDKIIASFLLGASAYFCEENASAEINVSSTFAANALNTDKARTLIYNCLRISKIPVEDISKMKIVFKKVNENEDTDDFFDTI